MSSFFQGAQDAFASSEAVALARKNNVGTNFIIPALLFMVLAPGLVLSIPATTKADEVDSATSKKHYLATHRVTWASAAVHALVFVVLLRVVNTVVVPMLFKPKN